MKIRRKVALASGLLLLLTNGCGILYYLSESDEHRTMRMAGYELCHLESCGPDALSDAFKHLGVNETPIEIGKDIQDNDKSHYRAILGLASHRFHEITCPPELKQYVKGRGFKVTVVKGFDQLGKGDVAIVLLRGRDDLRDWHWICYPEYSKSTISEFFGDDTIIKAAYVLEK